MTVQNPELAQNAIVQLVTRQTTTEGVSGDNTVLASPGAGKLICIKFLSVQNSVATATVAIIKEGATEKFTMVNANQGDGIVLDFEAGFEWRLPEDTALVLNLDGAVGHYVNLWHWEEDTP